MELGFSQAINVDAQTQGTENKLQWLYNTIQLIIKKNLKYFFAYSVENKQMLLSDCCELFLPCLGQKRYQTILESKGAFFS